MTDGGIKSKKRVAEFGEVFTPKNIVDDMLDLVKEESYKVNSTFLEPACGNGNFLVEILKRKLGTVKKDLSTFDTNMFKAVTTIYGIDIQLDNVEESKARMVEIIKTTYEDVGKELSDRTLKNYIYILDKNIIWGDALTERLMGDIHTGEEYSCNNKSVDNRPELKITEWSLQGQSVEMTEHTLKEIADSDKIAENQLKLEEFSEFNFEEKETNIKEIESLGENVTNERVASILAVYEELEKAVEEAAIAKEELAADKSKRPKAKKRGSKAMSAW